jgi:hypothetical protein
LVPQKETALFCGIRMVYHTKNIVEGVSGNTDATIAILREDLDPLQRRVEELEAELEQTKQRHGES